MLSQWKLKKIKKIKKFFPLGQMVSERPGLDKHVKTKEKEVVLLKKFKKGGVDEFSKVLKSRYESKFKTIVKI